MESIHQAPAPAAATPLPPVGGLWRKVKREPLWHFLILGTLLFIAAHWVQTTRTNATRQIVIDDALEKRIAQLTQTQTGVTPTGEQLNQLVQNYIDDEVMYREALRMGLDQEDEIVRRRLIQKVQFLQRDLASTVTPSESDLRAYYSAHTQLFSLPASVAFEQLYFSADRGGWGEAEARARHARNQLGSVTPASALPTPALSTPTISTSTIASSVPMATQIADDSFPLQIPSEELTRNEAGRLFGATPIVDALFTAPEGAWSGPFRSAYGWHLVKVDHLRTSALAPYAEVRGQVMAAYLQDLTQAAERRGLDSLRARYTIVRTGQGKPNALERSRQ